MTRYELCYETVLDVLAAECGIDPTHVTEASTLQGDLGMDSVGLLSLALELENRFEMYLGEDSNQPPETVGDIVSLLTDRLMELRDAS